MLINVQLRFLASRESPLFYRGTFINFWDTPRSWEETTKIVLEMPQHKPFTVPMIGKCAEFKENHIEGLFG